MMKKIFTQSNNGFNLMELIIAGVILGVLAGLAMPRFNTVIERFRAKEGETTLRDFYGAQKRYFIEHQAYCQNSNPDDLSCLDITVPILKYFDNPLLKYNTTYSGFTNGDPNLQVVVTIERKTGEYRLAIGVNGQVVCACDAASPICPKLGYTRYITW